VPTSDGGDDFIEIGDPLKGFGGVVVVEEAVDGRREVGDGSEDDSFKASLGEDGAKKPSIASVSRMIAFVLRLSAVRSTICPPDMLLRRVAVFDQRAKPDQGSAGEAEAKCRFSCPRLARRESAENPNRRFKCQVLSTSVSPSRTALFGLQRMVGRPTVD